MEVINDENKEWTYTLCWRRPGHRDLVRRAVGVVVKASSRVCGVGSAPCAAHIRGERRRPSLGHRLAKKREGGDVQ